jgi:hypothetical protein
MRQSLLLLAMSAWLTNAPGPVIGQAPAPPAPSPAANAPASPLDQAPFLAAALSEVFSDSRAFSAQAILQLPGDQPNQGIPLGFATLNGHMRWYLNLDQARSSRLDPALTTWLREARLNQVLFILRPETNALVVVPGLKQWFEFAPPKSPEIQAKAEEKVGFLQKTEVGRETVDGHPCVKYRLDLPKERGSGEQAFVWQATDLKNLPIKFQTALNGEIFTLLFRQIKDTPPDAKHFEPTAGYARVSGPETLLQNALLGGLTGNNPPAGAPLPSLNLQQLLGEGR